MSQIWNSSIRRCFCNSLLRNFTVSLEQSQCRKSDFHPASELNKNFNQKALRPKYAQIPALQTADERVQKIFSIEYGFSYDRKAKRIQELVQKILTDNEENNLVTTIVYLTVEKKMMQEKFAKSPRKHHYLRNKILHSHFKRRKSLNRLRDSQFEVYAKTMNVLGLKNQFYPEHDIKHSQLADGVKDMHIRAFAERRRLADIENKRKANLLKLKDKFIEEFSKSSTDLSADAILPKNC